MNVVSKMRNCVLKTSNLNKNDEFRITNDEFRVENDEFRVENDKFCRAPVDGSELLF